MPTPTICIHYEMGVKRVNPENPAILILAKKRLTAPLQTCETEAFPFVVGP